MKLSSETAICYLVSRKDIAGMNIQKFLPNKMQSQVLLLDNDSIYATDEIETNLPQNSEIIVLSRHSAKSLRPSFTVHPIGNFSNAEFGGEDSKLVLCNPFQLKHLLMEIKNQVESKQYTLKYEYEISIEVTHHGPYTSQATSFIEVGSSEDQWNDLEACRLVAQAVAQVDKKPQSIEKEWISVIGFGGNHYSTKFTKLVLDSEYAFGHVCAKYAIPALTDNLVTQMIKKTRPSPQLAVFDKKSMKRKQEIKNWLVNCDIDVVQV